MKYDQSKSRMYFMKDSLGSYLEYGIGVPLRDERVTKILSDYKNSKFLVNSKLTNFTLDELLLAHTPEFVESCKKDPQSVVLKAYELINEDGSYHRYDPDSATKPLSDFIQRALGHCEGTYLAACNALESGFSYHLGGGMHHAKSDGPGGFCLFNDMVIAIRKLQKDGKIKRALVIDTDAHKGDGTAEILKDDDSIDCISIHMKEGWPLDNPDKTNSSFTPSTYDIPVLPSDDYLKEQGRIEEYLNDDYDLCMVVQGADVYVDDILESAKGIQLSLEDCLKRDLYTYELLKKRGIPQAWVMAGGYGDEVYKVFRQFVNSQFKP